MNRLVFRRVVSFYCDAFVSLIFAYFLWLISKDDFDDQLTMNYKIGFYQFSTLMIYLCVCESIFKTTIGKYIMKLKIVPSRKGKLNYASFFLRTISRLIPFDILSFAFTKNGETWHDLISKTRVVDR